MKTLKISVVATLGLTLAWRLRIPHRMWPAHPMLADLLIGLILCVLLQVVWAEPKPPRRNRAHKRHGASNNPVPVRTVLQLGDPVLRQKAVPVADPTAPEVRDLICDLADTLAHWRSETGYGRGIAAPQIGVLQRVVFLKLPGAEPWPLINPEIVRGSKEKIIVWDACLSFLSIFMQVERHREITVRYQSMDGSVLEIEAGEERSLSELLQHEIDHLDGILAIDRVTDVKTIVTREEFEKRYRDASPYAVQGAGR